MTDKKDRKEGFVKGCFFHFGLIWLKIKSLVEKKRPFSVYIYSLKYFLLTNNVCSFLFFVKHRGKWKVFSIISELVWCVDWRRGSWESNQGYSQSFIPCSLLLVILHNFLFELNSRNYTLTHKHTLFQAVSQVDPRTASWNSHRQGRSPSIAPDTFSIRMTPRKREKSNLML